MHGSFAPPPHHAQSPQHAKSARVGDPDAARDGDPGFAQDGGQRWESLKQGAVGMDWGTIRRVWLPLALSASALWWIFGKSSRTHGPANWIGLAIAVIGLAGVFVSRYTLGKSFSVKAKATALVTSGIYSRIRNPIYVSGVAFIIGIAITLGRPLILLLVVMIPMQIWRARREARALEEKFGEEYREYRRRTWF